MLAEERLKALGLVLPSVPVPQATYLPFKRDGSTVYLAGQGARRADGRYFTGKVADEVSIEEAYQCARIIAVQLLAVAHVVAGDLDRVEILKVLGMVNALSLFTDHPKVINGCSDLFVAVLGERGRHARPAVGMGSLPHNMPVEIEAVIKIHD